MAFYQSDIGKRLTSAPIVYEYGQVKCAEFTFTFSAGFVAASDKLELGEIPSDARILSVDAIPANLNGNITIGVMSGEVGDPDSARTVGSEIFNAQAMVSSAIRAVPVIAPTVNVRRSIGLTASADIAAAANKTITLRVYYTTFGQNG